MTSKIQRLFAIALVCLFAAGNVGCATDDGSGAGARMAGHEGGCAFAVPTCFKQGRTR